MRRSKGSAGEAEDLEVRFARAPVDRLFVGSIVAASLVYGGWLLALRLWPGEPEPDARQSFHGFVTGSSQPPAGGGELSPAEAGELGSSKLGISHYFGGATPRPIAAEARVVGSAELPEPSRQPSAPVFTSPKAAADRVPDKEPPKLGRLGVGPRVARWVKERVEPIVSALTEAAPPAASPPPESAAPN